MIDVTLDDEKQTITGRETITYINNSPHTLKYLWLQLDANIFRPDSDSALTRDSAMGRMSFGGDRLPLNMLKNMMLRDSFDGGVNITEVKDGNGKDIQFTVVKTMMRVDLPRVVLPHEEFTFQVAWNYKINDSDVAGGRTGSEFFEKDGNYIYEIAQWFPRMAAYTDATGWQHKQYLGAGEFTLELGDYLVRITVPSDHIVGATGVLQNPNEVLTESQRDRWSKPRPLLRRSSS